jgi:hypothetical protein
MTPINYTQMSDPELKQYLLTHKNDQNAFHAYLDCRHQTPQSPLITADELDPLSLQEQTELISQRPQQKYNL